MTVTKHLSAVAVAFLLTFGSTQSTNAEPLRIRYGIWVGYGPLFIAAEKGLFAREGVEVELIRIDDMTAAFAALFAAQVDGMVGGTQDIVTFAARFGDPSDEPVVCMLATDDSRGGDGILATKDIRTIADLRGKSVAVLRGNFSEFYLRVLLQEAGLSEADIEIIDLTADDALTAFLLQEVDAVVAGEPNLTQGRAAAHGHLLSDTSQHPGLLTACLFAKASVFAARKGEFKAIGRAWDEAVRFVASHPDEATAIMARNLGDWLEDPAVVDDMLRGVKLYDAASNREYFGTPEQPGPIYQTVQHAIDMWSSANVSDRKLSPADFIAHGVWED